MEYFSRGALIVLLATIFTAFSIFYTRRKTSVDGKKRARLTLIEAIALAGLVLAAASYATPYWVAAWGFAVTKRIMDADPLIEQQIYSDPSKVFQIPLYMGLSIITLTVIVLESSTLSNNTIVKGFLLLGLLASVISYCVTGYIQYWT